MKKINACITWLLIASLLGHFFTMSYSLLTGWYQYSVCKMLARATGGFATLHIVVTIIIFFFFHDGASTQKYARRNIKTILQRISGLVMVAILHLHLKAFSFIVSGTALSTGSKIGLLVTEILFFGSIFLHIATSFTNSLITMGILRSDRTEKIINVIVYALCGVFLLFTTIALTMFVVHWQ